MAVWIAPVETSKPDDKTRLADARQTQPRTAAAGSLADANALGLKCHCPTPSFTKNYIMKRNLILILCFPLLLILQPCIAETPPDKTASGIPLDAPWKSAVYQFSKTNLQHSAWGLAHCERDFQLAHTLAMEEKLVVDTDVLFAAAFLHDMGVFEPYPKAGVDHTERAAEVAGEVLQAAGFPKVKLSQVQAAMRSHMFYSQVEPSPEARLLHDVDTLDFLGNIGMARIFSVTSRHRWATTLPDAVATLEKFKRELPAKLVTESARKRAVSRVAEMDQFLRELKAESFDSTAL